MKIDDLKYYIYADLYRAYGYVDKKLFIKVMLGLKGVGTKFIIIMRICKYLNQNYKNNLFTKIMILLIKKYKVKYGIEMEYSSEISFGLCIPHPGTIVVGQKAVIGKNCTILQGVTIGSNLYKSRYELAEIGDNVLIGAGAKIIGPLKIGNDVTIGANSVVTKDIPDGAVVAGNPAKILSFKKSIVINDDYLDMNEFINRK